MRSAMYGVKAHRKLKSIASVTRKWSEIFAFYIKLKTDVPSILIYTIQCTCMCTCACRRMSMHRNMYTTSAFYDVRAHLIHFVKTHFRLWHKFREPKHFLVYFPFAQAFYILSVRNSHKCTTFTHTNRQVHSILKPVGKDVARVMQ